MSINDEPTKLIFPSNTLNKSGMSFKNLILVSKILELIISAFSPQKSILIAFPKIKNQMINGANKIITKTEIIISKILFENL